MIPQLKDEVSLCARIKKALTGLARRAPAGSRAPTDEVAAGRLKEVSGALLAARVGLKTESSMSRYTKETHALKALHRIPLQVTEYGTYAKKNLPAILSGQVPLLPFQNQLTAQPV